MPHHIIAMTTGPAAIEASIPANCRYQKVRARTGETAACAAREAEAGSRTKGGRYRPRRKENLGPRTARPQTAR